MRKSEIDTIICVECSRELYDGRFVKIVDYWHSYEDYNNPKLENQEKIICKECFKQWFIE